MKRQHPIDPNIFWCPKCQTYKQREEFYYVERSFNQIYSLCKKCTIKKITAYNKYLYHNNEENKKFRKDKAKKQKKDMPEKAKEWNKKAHKKLRETLSDTYIKRLAWRKGDCGFRKMTTAEIEMRRQVYLMRKTLKEFKEWRKENEPNYTDVHGKQRQDEANYEGRVQTRTGNGGTERI